MADKSFTQSKHDCATRIIAAYATYSGYSELQAMSICNNFDLLGPSHHSNIIWEKRDHQFTSRTWTYSMNVPVVWLREAFYRVHLAVQHLKLLKIWPGVHLYFVSNILDSKLCLLCLGFSWSVANIISWIMKFWTQNHSFNFNWNFSSQMSRCEG